MSEIHTPKPRKNPRLIRTILMIGIAVFAAALIISTATRMAAKAEVAKWTKDESVPSVSIVKVKSSNTGELILPARLQAWAEAPVYARTNGYLKSWSADIGTPVKQGQVLAEIETPEVDHELVAAKAALGKVQADRTLAQANAARSEALVKIGAVSKQDSDEKRSSLASFTAQVNQAQAEVERLTTLSDFKNVVSPFDGTVTSRSTDVGALIDSSSSAAPLFTISDTTKLRLYVSVPENYVSLMTSGLAAAFVIPELPQQKFTAQIEKTSGAIDRTTGTMLVQLVVNNKEGLLKPGSYAQLHFDLSNAKASLRIPASTLIFRKEGTSVAVLGNDNKAVVKPVTIARDYGTEIEISQGVDANDQLIDSPPDSITTGDAVKPIAPKAAEDSAKESQSKK